MEKETTRQAFLNIEIKGKSGKSKQMLRRKTKMTETRNVNDIIPKTRKHVKEAGRAERERKKETITMKPILTEPGRNFYI